MINTEANKENVFRNILRAPIQFEERHAIGFIKHAIEFYTDCLEKNEIL